MPIYPCNDPLPSQAELGDIRAFAFRIDPTAGWLAGWLAAVRLTLRPVRGGDQVAFGGQPASHVHACGH
jgi:hypothetical protein